MVKGHLLQQMQMLVWRKGATQMQVRVHIAASGQTLTESIPY